MRSALDDSWIMGLTGRDVHHNRFRWPALGRGRSRFHGLTRGDLHGDMCRGVLKRRRLGRATGPDRDSVNGPPDGNQQILFN